MIQKLRAGFTIVELLIAVAVILILAVIVVVMYDGMQERANDTKLRDATVKVASAIQLFTAKYDHPPRGGFGSTTAISGNECADGENGFIASQEYLCSVEDTLVASGYLPQGFIASLPKNTVYNPTSTTNLSIMVHLQTVSSKQKAMVFHAMEAPSSADTATFNAELTKCGIDPGGTVPQRDSWGMRNGLCVDL